MTHLAKYFAAAVAVSGIATPALAQTYPYQQTYPQTYPPQGYPQTGYAQPGYPQQGYGTNPIQGMIDQLLGNRYSVRDRAAVRQCATAAMAQASAQYRPPYNQGYQRPYDQRYQHGQQYGQQYRSGARVTGITNVERRMYGLLVSGVLDSGRYRGYRNGGYPDQSYNQAYAAGTGDLTFSCTADYRGAVTSVFVRPNPNFRRPY
ncbi:hypothetical protein [Sphingomonas sp.]|uniref:hypothetical protein n=1 Tax=Sphingomonas sp. TaxID=28214 RepID=UPI00286A737A|nr:hypothetical protein [Sphingomonas sp.]